MKIPCPKCQRKIEVAKCQIGSDLDCSCGIAFTLSRKLYSTAANRRLALVFGIAGGTVALVIALCVILAQGPVDKAEKPTTTPPAANLPPSPPPELPPAAPELVKTPVPLTTPMAVVLPTPFAWWKFDESSGQIAADAVGKHPGTLVGYPVWRPGLGVDGGALALRFSGQRVEVKSPLNLNSNTVTATAWLKITDSGPKTGIICWRDGKPAGTKQVPQMVTGLGINANNELSYAWKEEDYKVTTGLAIPKNSWVFVAMVVDREQAILYLGTSSGLRSFANKRLHEPEPFKNLLWIGGDCLFTSRTVRSRLDDVRIYDQSLSPEEIGELHRQGRAGLTNNPAAEKSTEDKTRRVKLESPAWNAAALPENTRLTWELNASGVITGTGNYTVAFNGKSGRASIVILHVTAVQDKKSIGSSAHEGMAGFKNAKNSYILQIKKIADKLPVTLRVDVVPQGSTDTAGEIEINRMEK